MKLYGSYWSNEKLLRIQVKYLAVIKSMLLKVEQLALLLDEVSDDDCEVESDDDEVVDMDSEGDAGVASLEQAGHGGLHSDISRILDESMALGDGAAMNGGEESQSAGPSVESQDEHMRCMLTTASGLTCY